MLQIFPCLYEVVLGSELRESLQDGHGGLDEEEEEQDLVKEHEDIENRLE